MEASGSTEETEDKDAARPNYGRQAGEIAILLVIFDAEPLDKKKFGSRQFFLMDLLERFYKEIFRNELHRLKGFFDKRKLLQDITIESINKGVFLVVHCSTSQAVDALAKDYESAKLEKAFIECFLNPQLEKKLNVRNFKLKLKIWEEELDAVKAEWTNKELPKSFNLKASEKDAKTVTYIYRFQKSKLASILGQLRDFEYKFEETMPFFLVFLKQHGPTNPSVVKTIKEAQQLHTLITTTKEAKKHAMPFTTYLEKISDLTKIIREIETNIWFPLIQIRRGCETEGQMKTKADIQKGLTTLKAALRDTAFFSLSDPKWEAKISSGSERKLYGAMISFLPAAVQKLADIDQLLDQYLHVGEFAELEASSTS